MLNKIIIGTRGSKLSLAYANKVKNLISKTDLTVAKKIKIEKIKTSGDVFQNKKYLKLEVKIYFVKK